MLQWWCIYVKAGGTVYLDICRLAQAIIGWSEIHLVSISAKYILEKNIPMEQLSCPDHMLPTEWTLLPQLVKGSWREFSCPCVGLFLTKAYSKLFIYVSPIPDLMAWKEDVFQPPWDNIYVYNFPPFPLLRQVLSGVILSHNPSMILMASLWPQKEWFMDLLSLLVKETLEPPMLWNLLVQPLVRKFHILVWSHYIYMRGEETRI